MTVTFLRNTGQLFEGCLSVWVSLIVSWWTGLVCFGKHTTKVISGLFSTSIHLISGSVTSDHLVQEASARLLLYQVTCFFFIINKYILGVPSRLHNILFLIFSPVSFGADLIVIFYLYYSFCTYQLEFYWILSSAFSPLFIYIAMDSYLFYSIG